MKNVSRITSLSALLTALFLMHSAALAWTPLAVEDDPVVRMPGTQPALGIDNMTAPAMEAGSCINCHGELAPDDVTIFPTFDPGGNAPIVGFWMGSMMGQAARDPLFWAAMTVAAQDSIWALGNPNAADICERCHFPEGWLAGRSDPANASLMEASDFDGVHCDVCHRMYDPFFEDTHAGTREGSDWAGYWDEAAGGISQGFADATLAADQALAASIDLFSGAALYNGSNFPFYSATYTENAAGQFFVSPDAAKRGPLADHDVGGEHDALYSRYYKSKFFCSTCHDVSNPALANVAALNTLPDLSSGADLITEQYSAFNYGHVERTFSEFMLSEYGRTVGGAAVNAGYTAQLPAEYSITSAGKCQDCHMREVTGISGAGGVLRPPGPLSEHTAGVAVHDMQGGNIWITRILNSLFSNDDNTYDPVNEALLVGRTVDLTVDFTAGSWASMNNGQILNGALRAEAQLNAAATLTDIVYNRASGVLSFKVQNNTGHKLISGYPEGRRMFVNVQGSKFGALLQEVNPYDPNAGTLVGMNLKFDYTPYHNPSKDIPTPSTTTANGQMFIDDLIYEMKTSSSLTGETPTTFHFVLADGRYKDNRIPPRGFTLNAEVEQRMIQTVYKGVADSVGNPDNFFTPAEYAGGYDAVTLQLVPHLDEIVISLKYQGTSREYIQFLRDEINGTATTLPEPTFAQKNGLNPDADPAYLVATDAFFTGLRGWGDVIWELWLHNHGLSPSTTPTNVIPGIAPFDMVSTTITAADLEMETGYIVALTVDAASVTEGTTLTFTATPSVGTIGDYEYDFLIEDENSKLFSQIGGYTAANTFELPTATGDEGTVTVWARVREVTSTNDYEASDDVTATITAATPPVTPPVLPPEGSGSGGSDGGCFLQTLKAGE